jgi:hypothetical protein
VNFPINLNFAVGGLQKVGKDNISLMEYSRTDVYCKTHKIPERGYYRDNPMVKRIMEWDGIVVSLSLY